MTRLATLALALSVTTASAQDMKLPQGDDAPRGLWSPPACEVERDGVYATCAYGGMMIATCPDVPLPVDKCVFVEINRYYPQTGTHILIEIRKGPDVLVIVYGDGRVIGDPRLFPEASRLFFEAMARAYPPDMHARKP